MGLQSSIRNQQYSLEMGVVLSLLFFLIGSLMPGSISVAWGEDFNVANGDEVALVNAINNANADAETDVINLAPSGLYTLSVADNTIDGPNGLPSITSKIIINGNGATIRRSAQLVPEFRIIHVAATGVLTLNKLTVRHGLTPKGGPGPIGGLLPDDGGDGGGIYNRGSLTVNTSAIQDNQTGDGGDGLLIPGNGGSGGGIFNNGGTLALVNSTVSDNVTGATGMGSLPGSADGDGGGIYNNGSASVTSSTISKNLARGRAGGIYNSNHTIVTSSTFTENSAQVGGGIYNVSTLDISGTIIAQQAMASDCAGSMPVNSLGHNLDSDGSCALDATGDKSGATAKLGLLQDNGGPTQTHALLSDSPAIDGGGDDAPVMDQRGYSRLFDGNGDGTAAPDIGAVEYFDCDGNNLDDADPTDSDGDLSPDQCDQCPNDANKIAAGTCGCGTPDDDSDNDGLLDCADNCPNEANVDQADADDDGVGDACAQPPAGEACCGGGTATLMAVPLVLLLCSLRAKRRFAYRPR